MAIEDEIINISDIDVGTEILNSDKLLIETSNGTKMVAFKDFVVGPDNISSVRQSQIEGNAEGEANTFYNVITGFQILNDSTTPGLNTQYDQISGSIELGKFNYNAIANLASVSADIASNGAAVDELRVVLDNLASVLEATENSVLSNITLSTSACNAIVNGPFKGNKRSSALSFTTVELNPSTTNSNCTLTLDPFKITFPSADEGFVDGSRYMINGQFNGRGDFGRHAFARTGLITIYRDKSDGSSEEVYKKEGVSTSTSTHFTIDFNAVVRINLGDTLRFTFAYTPKSGKLDIFKIS